MDFRRYRCRRVFFTGENRKPDFAECDFALTFDPDSERNLRLPYYVVATGGDLPKLCAARDGARLVANKTKFCNFIYSNFHSPIRNLFFSRLACAKTRRRGRRTLQQRARAVVALFRELARGEN